MEKFLRKILRLAPHEEKEISQEKDLREKLENKVEEGTDRAIREYREVFKKLAEYDRT